MSLVDEVLADVGRGIGIPNLAFNDQGVASLHFELLGAVFLERVDGGVLMYIAREIDRPSAELFAAALDLCHWRHNHPRDANPAMRQDRFLIFSAKLTDEEFTLPAIEQTMQLLGSLHDQAREGIAA